MIIHERTGTSRAAREIENQLAKKLERIGKRIRQEPGFLVGDLNGLRRKYAPEILSEIQMSVQQVYLLGLKYVGEFEEVNTLLTSRDLQQIQQQSDQQSEMFWRAVVRDMSREMSDRKPVQLTATAALIATSTATGALMLATVDKVQQLGDIDAEVMFITAVDERVCPICRPLHRKTWSANDPFIIRPILDTHPNCRCRLLLKSGEEVFSH